MNALQDSGGMNSVAHLLNAMLRNVFKRQWMVKQAPGLQSDLTTSKAIVTYLAVQPIRQASPHPSSRGGDALELKTYHAGVGL